MDEVCEGCDVYEVGLAQAKCDHAGDGELFNEGFKHSGAWEEEGVFKKGVMVELSGNELGDVGSVRVNELIDPTCTSKHCDPLGLSRGQFRLDL